MMDKKCEQFLSKLAERFSEENVSNDELLTIFNEAVASLPKSKFKKNLSQNSDAHFQSFQKFYENGQTEITNSSMVLQDTNSVIAQILSYQKNQTQLKTVLQVVVEKLRNGKTSKTQIVSKFCCFALSFKHSNILHAIAHTLFSYFESELDPLLTSKTDVHELEAVVEDMLKVLTLLPNIFHRQGFSQKKENEFFDVISAILSLYIDAKANISILNCDSKEIKTEVGNRLVELVNIVLGLNSSKFLDTLLQITSTKSPKAFGILQPLYIYFFSKTTIDIENLTVIRYLQILLAIRQSAQLIEKNSEGGRKITEISDHCMAPEGFHTWVISREGGSNLLDITPLTKTSAPGEITDYLLKEAEIEIVEDFVDLYHQPIIREDQDTHVEEKSLEEISDKDLFEIVTKGNPPMELDNDAGDKMDEDITNDDRDDDVDDSIFKDEKLFEISTKEAGIWDNLPDMLTKHKNDIDSQDSHHESDMEEFNLLKETEHLLVDKKMNESDDGNNNGDNIVATKQEVENSDAETGIHTRTTPKRKAKLTKKEPYKLARTELSVIHEDNNTESKTDLSTKLFSSTRKLRSRSDSESSTGSNHSYMTRSKRSIIS